MICVLRLYGHTEERIGDMLGIHKGSVSRILNTPKGREMMLDMQEKQIELAVDPIQQKLSEYADEAADKLHELLEADGEAVQRQAAKDILEMAGYTPKRTVTQEKEAPPTIIVGQINMGGESDSNSGNNANGSPRPIPVEAEYAESHHGQPAQEERERDEQEAAIIVQRPDSGEGRGERDAGQASEHALEGQLGILRSDITDEGGDASKPGQRWVGTQGWTSSNDV